MLIIAGDEGNVATYKFTNDTWYSYDNRLALECFTIIHILSGNIYDAFMTTYMQKPVLVVLGANGEVASAYLDSNSWTYPDGRRYDNIRKGPLIYHDGSSRDFSDIYRAAEYLDYYVLVGKEGLITLYNIPANEFEELGDWRNISNDGHHNGYRDIYSFINYEGSILVTGASEGKITSYFGENEHWNEHNSSAGISNDGNLLENNTVYTIAYTFGYTNYIIFAGENGKVGTYNVDVHELPFRFDPYKTAFLLWYKTPGNAYIKTIWRIPHNVINLFNVYKDNEDTNYDIQIAGGDTDIIADIDMNDRGRYPKPYKERRKYMADFIMSLPEGRYSPSEVWERYMESKHKHILYHWDVIPLTSGDEVDSEEDIDLTNITEGEN
jgi:hypothetical protein